MLKYGHILLHIPHAAIGGLHNAGWADYSKLVKDVHRMTDWHTDWLFCLDDWRVSAVVSAFSRFVVDCERLENDPLESIGQGIIYSKSDSGNTRVVLPSVEAILKNFYSRHINKLRERITEDTILIDCHSFPSDMSDVDICIGFNDDWSRPSGAVIDSVCGIFEKEGYSVGRNVPYSNSISPVVEGIKYPSLMIEVNKRCYMDEKTLDILETSTKLRETISKVYNTLLK